MKMLKKSLAVILSVLMIIASFPLTALAKWHDTDVELHAYIMNYDDGDSWGYGASVIKEFDPTNFSKDQLSSTDGAFAFIITYENLDDVPFSHQFMFKYDSSVITPAEYVRQGKNYVLKTGTAYAEPLYSYKDIDTNFDQTGISSAYLGNPMIYMPGSYEKIEALPDPYEQMDYNWENSYTYPGVFVASFGFQLLTDETVDLTEVIKFENNYNSFFSMTEGDWSNDLHCYGATNTKGEPYPEDEYTYMIFPEWGIAPEGTEPTEVTYTYTFADQHTEQVTAAAGEAPVAPANTATTDWAPDNKGNHTRTSYSWPEWQDGVTEYTEVATPETAACEMVEKEAQVDPTHTTPGKTAVMECSVCGYTTGGEEIPADADAHSYTEVERVESTCKTQGHVKYECECGDTYTETLELDPSNHEKVVTDPAVAADCVTTGLTEGSHCEACGATIVEQEVIEALGHDYQITSSTDATCCVEGTVTYTCSRCDDTYTEEGVLDPTNHADYGTKVEHAKEPTRGEDGYTGDTVCNGCGATITKGEVIPALGVQITVTANELGSTTLNGEATTGAAQKVAYAKDYTLAATANEGAEFVGWSVAGKIVSTSATYTTTAYADTTYVPVFAESESDAFTVTFVDQFNKVVTTIDSTELASLEALPTAPTYMGYTFDSWNLTLDEVKALEEATVVTASYTKNDLSYTVSAPNCTITVDGQAYEDTATVGFDAKVTVAPKADTATSWTVNGATAAYGESYTFYVTADVNVAYGTDSVTAAPTVSNVSAELVSADSHQVRFLATRSVPEGYTLVESGFVYGKGMAQDDLVLENVGTVQGTANGTVKLAKNSNTAGDGQFALTYGVTAKNATACARAYIIVKDAEGVATVYYADAQIFDYQA